MHKFWKSRCVIAIVVATLLGSPAFALQEAVGQVEAPPEQPDTEAPATESPAGETADAEQETPQAEPAEDAQGAGEPKAEPAAVAKLPEEITLTDFVTVPVLGSYGRAAVHIDPVDAAIAAGTFTMPKAGDEITTYGGRTAKWRTATAGDNGVLSTRSIRGGYAAAQIELPAAGILRLQAPGAAAVYVNGRPYAGDPYAFGNFALPVPLQQGTNTLVFHVAQSELSAKLFQPAEPISLAADRVVFPTLVRGDPAGNRWASVTITNAGDQPLTGATIVAQLDGQEAITTPLAWMDAASMRRCGFEFAVPESLDQEVAELVVRLNREDEVLAESRYELEVVAPTATQVRTFVSQIDRSVQSYVVVPAADAATSDQTQTISKDEPASEAVGAMVALHTDGMAPRDFAAQYTPKSWAHLVVPSGRGLYPLDWEEWSRIDAVEAQADAMTHYKIDPQRIYATGHGMGGHGALVLATHQPDRFAAVATSAAWPSLWTYGGGMPSYRSPSPVQSMLLRAASPSDTLAQLTNMRGVGTYVLHGTDDEEVPPEQSRQIIRSLANWHNDFAFCEKADVGNWWGAETVDDPAAMEFLAARTRPAVVADRVSLTTSDLGSLATSHWATIAAQEKQFARSRIELQRKENPLTILGTTENVRRLVIDKAVVPPKQPFVVRLDGGRPVLVSGMPAAGRVWLEKQGNRWRRRFAPDKSDKGPQRYGGMKAVFDNDVLLVYGTIGNDEENAWSRAKAHFDADTFAYRANGGIEVVPDTEFDAKQTTDRNVVVYGNVDTNQAWAALLSTTPVQVFRGRMTVETRPLDGDDLGFLMVRPRAGSNTRLVAAVGGTGLQGMRLTGRLRYFWAGVGYPDFVLLGGDALTAGDGGIRAIGYFAEDWDLDNADIAWRNLAL